MRRADRLFHLVQLLRGRRVVTAGKLARELRVSLRTVYRDVRDLLAAGVPIDGAAGVGYRLRRGFDLPPLMFDADEIRALVLGVRVVEAFGDAALSRSARSVLSKVETVLPERLRPHLADPTLVVPWQLPEAIRANVERFRLAIGARRKVRFVYVDEKSSETCRTVWPLGLAFWGTKWTAVAWCELRQAFRSFRPDRMRDVETLPDIFEPAPGRDLESCLKAISDDAWP